MMAVHGRCAGIRPDDALIGKDLDSTLRPCGDSGLSV